ncbi:MAG: BatA domain-containing protein [Tenacibaculum sp.]
MQFKHPEILYLLVLLLLPVIVHLFHLQRFVKVSFTNVAFLHKLVLQTRKSSRIKKWLILATRLLMLASLIIAFAQPYLSNSKADEKPKYFIYLDNSLSMTAEGNKGKLLQVAVQELIESLSDKIIYTLQTNSHIYSNKTASELKDILWKIEQSAQQKKLKNIFLKISAESKAKHLNQKNILISDFQNTSADDFKYYSHKTSLVQLFPQLKENLSLDSVFINKADANNLVLNIAVKNQGTSKKNIPIALYNQNKLVSKQTFNIDKNTTKTIKFTMRASRRFAGKIFLNFKDAFLFDNSFYFALNTTEKINVLSIGKSASFLTKIYTTDEFNFQHASIQHLNYNTIPKQQLVILNELNHLPQNFQVALTNFTAKGGSLVVIPSLNININSYIDLLRKLNINGVVYKAKTDSLKISNINFNHPIFTSVFEKKIYNFQYPSVASSYISSFSNASTVLSFENKKDFISQINLKNFSFYWFATSLNKQNSNFVNSPLIVPVFYNIGKQSLQLPKLYFRAHKQNTIDINHSSSKNTILSVGNQNSSFIPLQQVFQNKVRISTLDQPDKAGFYSIYHNNDTLKKIAFNYPARESLLSYTAVQQIAEQKENLNYSISLKNTLANIIRENKIQWLWNWFLILSIISLIIEILLLKFFKP